LPIRQKEIIESVRKKVKPVIVATQMLDSMIRNPIPTRAEVSDVANAVFDSTDAVMLSGETASGKYPLEAVEMMTKILSSTDNSPNSSCDNVNKKVHSPQYLIVAKSAAEMAANPKVKAIIVNAANDTLPTAISHFRPCAPIIATTKKPEVAQFLALVWGVNALLTKSKTPTEEAKKLLINSGVLKEGDKVVCVHSVDSVIIETI
jgi:pyruvate kinase